MNDRDHFAAAALTGLLLDGDETQCPADHIAECAYKMADAMLAERDKSAAKRCVNPLRNGAPEYTYGISPDAESKIIAPVHPAARHAFKILEQLGPEADRLGIKVVDAYGQSGPVSEFLPKIVRYIEAREAEIDRMRLTDAEREAIKEACDEGRWYPRDYHCVHAMRGLLERTK